MMQEVSMHGSITKAIPHRFEVGTPNIESILGLGAAIHFIQSIGWHQIRAHQERLQQKIDEYLKDIWFLKEVQTSDRKVPIYHFILSINLLIFIWCGKLLSNQYGILVTVGQQCVHPFMNHWH